jgi:hypothetical protein
MRMIFQYWAGDERGSETPKAERFPITIPVTTQIPIQQGRSKPETDSASPSWLTWATALPPKGDWA